MIGEHITYERTDSNPAWWYHYEKYPLDIGTHLIDFRVTAEYKDPILSNACIRVLTSDGIIGSLSHLTVFHNPELFATDLLQLLGKRGIPTILNGGQGNWWPSRALRDRLRVALTNCGFVLSKLPENEDTLGLFTREALLTREMVFVTRYPNPNQKPESLILHFPS